MKNLEYTCMLKLSRHALTSKLLADYGFK